MNPMKKTRLIFPLLFFLCTLSGIAQRGWYSPGGSYDLNLSDKQLDAIHDLTLDFQKDMLSLSSQLEKFYLELDTMERNGDDRSKINAKLEELNQREDMIDRRIMEHQEAVRNLLTKEQQVLFDEYGGLDLGPAMGMGFGLGRARGYQEGIGRGYGRGVGYGRGYGIRQGVGLRDGYSVTRGYGRGVGYGRGNTGFGRMSYGYGRGVGYGRGNAGFGRMSYGYGRAGIGIGRGGGRGRFCPRLFYNTRFPYRNRW